METHGMTETETGLILPDGQRVYSTPPNRYRSHTQFWVVGPVIDTGRGWVHQTCREIRVFDGRAVLDAPHPEEPIELGAEVAETLRVCRDRADALPENEPLPEKVERLRGESLAARERLPAGIDPEDDIDCVVATLRYWRAALADGLDADITGMTVEPFNQVGLWEGHLRRIDPDHLEAGR